MSKEIISIKVILQRFIEVTLRQTIFRMKRIYTFFSCPRGNLVTQTTDKSICLNHLPSGVYVLHIVTDSDILKTKFIHL